MSIVVFVFGIAMMSVPFTGAVGTCKQEAAYVESVTRIQLTRVTMKIDNKVVKPSDVNIECK